MFVDAPPGRPKAAQAPLRGHLCGAGGHRHLHRRGRRYRGNGQSGRGDAGRRGAQVRQHRRRAATAGGHMCQRPFRYRVARMTEASRSPSRVARLPIATSSPSSTSSTARWARGRAQGRRRSWADSWIAATRETRSDPVSGTRSSEDRQSQSVSALW
jgi:hypothetical protein